MNRQSLVSVVVVTYHSSATVLETLESIRAQSYGNIELIVSDDASGDDTVEKVRGWLKVHASAFFATNVLSASGNGGIPANCNRGLAAASGVYVKLIAGDDLLTADCIAFDVEQIGEEAILCTGMSCKRAAGISSLPPSDIRNTQLFFALPTHEQFRSYIRNPVFLNTPTFFFKRSLFDLIGNFDERIRLLEDQPFICKALAQGERIRYADHVTVLYRVSEGSTMGGQSRAFLRCLLQCFWLYRLPYLRWYSFPEVLLVVESACLQLLLTRALYHPALITWFKKCCPSRIFLESGFKTHMAALLFRGNPKLKT